MQSAHDSVRDGCSDAERIAESNEVIPNLYLVGITHRDRDKVGCSYPDHRNIGHRITGNSRTMNPASISEADGIIVRVLGVSGRTGQLSPARHRGSLKE
jgi:hypothetical protein